METVRDFILGGSKITADGECSHEIKRLLFLRRKAMTNLSSVQFSCSVMSDSLQPHGLQHARPPRPSPAPRVYSKSCPLSQWYHPTISSDLIPFSSCLQSFPASGSLQISLHFRRPKDWSFSFSISPSNEYSGLISFRISLDLLAVQGTLKSLLQHHSSKASVLRCSAFFNSPTLTSIHDYWKNHSFD